MNTVFVRSNYGKPFKVDFTARKVTLYGKGFRKEIVSFEKFIAGMPFQDAPTIDQKLLKLIWKMAGHRNTIDAFGFTF